MDSLYGKMKAKVLLNSDPSKKGRIGVFIPRVMGIIGNSNEKTEETEMPNSDSKNDSNNAVSSKSPLTKVNYIWAKPAQYTLYGGSFVSGEFKVPPVGSKVFVEFIDGNPEDLYYLPYGPADQTDGLDFAPYAASKGSEYVEIILKSLAGSITGFDSTSGTDKFFLIMKDGAQITVDGKENAILISTKDSAAKINCSGSAINITCDNANVKGKNVTVSSDSNTIIDGGTVEIKTPDGLLWQPNVFTNCLIAGVPHGGAGAGISCLKGGAHA